jgi:surfactin synthase thioesterase subunit
VAAAPGSWFGSSPVRRQADAVLFCLPYAGGGAAAFSRWRRVFPDSVAIEPVRLPGREQRFGEPLRIDPAEVAAAVLARADGRAWAIYGHSMGGWLGFEVVRELRRRGGPLPARLYVGATRPPHVAEPLAAIAELPDDEFLRRLIDIGDTPPEALGVPELRELLLPILRADFGWLNRYAYRDEPPLPVPVVAFAGADDTVVEPAVMDGWSRHTAAGFTLHVLPGDHFFLDRSADRLATLLVEDLLAPAPSSSD